MRGLDDVAAGQGRKIADHRRLQVHSQPHRSMPQPSRYSRLVRCLLFRYTSVTGRPRHGKDASLMLRSVIPPPAGACRRSLRCFLDSFFESNLSPSSKQGLPHPGLGLADFRPGPAAFRRRAGGDFGRDGEAAVVSQAVSDCSVVVSAEKQQRVVVDEAEPEAIDPAQHAQ